MTENQYTIPISLSVAAIISDLLTCVYIYNIQRDWFLFQNNLPWKTSHFNLSSLSILKTIMLNSTEWKDFFVPL